MNTVSKMMVRVAVMATMAAGFAMAQNAMKGTIPFDFTVGNTTLAAGEYTLESSPGTQLLQVRDARERTVATVVAMAGADRPANPDRSFAVFRVHGTKYYLASTWNGNMWNGKELKRSAAEREADMAGIPARVTVLLAQR